MSRLKKSFEQGGFTLVELMVTMTLVGVLAAQAIPHYNAYRMRSYDKMAQLSLRHVAIAEEAYFAEHQSFKSCNQDTCSALLPGLGQLSEGVLLTIASTGNTFTGSSNHPKGSGEVFQWP